MRVANREIFHPAGLVLVNPLDRGLRLVEVVEASGSAAAAAVDADGVHVQQV